MLSTIRTAGVEYPIPPTLAQHLIDARSARYKPRSRARVNAEGEAPAMLTISAGGVEYQLPGDLVLAMLGGLTLKVAVGEQSITGSFECDVPAGKTPDTELGELPLKLNAVGSMAHRMRHRRNAVGDGTGDVLRLRNALAALAEGASAQELRAAIAALAGADDLDETGQADTGRATVPMAFNSDGGGRVTVNSDAADEALEQARQRANEQLENGWRAPATNHDQVALEEARAAARRGR